MVSVRESDKKSGGNLNVLVVIFSFLLMVSIAMMVAGLINGWEKVDADDNDTSVKINFDKEEAGDSLTDIFQKEFSQISEEGTYAANDPFRETCAPVSGSEPATTSFTVCQP